MKHIIALVGVRGAGKSTLFASVDKHPYVEVLKPTTDRPKRNNSEEYDFEKVFPHGNAMAWKLKVGDYNYGVSKDRVKSIPDGHCGVTVFDPGNIDILENYRQEWREGEIVTVGLDTIENLSDQHNRVESDQDRMMTQEDFDAHRKNVLNSDIVLRGDADAVRKATIAICEILVSRGGIVGRNWLEPLISAEALLDGAKKSQIEPASYDLRLGDEVWCQGSRHLLTAEKPFFKIPPYSYAIVKAEEIAQIPCFMAGRFDITVSLFFKGVLLSNGPQVDPGYHGALFCTLFNGRDVHTDLKMGEHFATLEFCVLGTRVDEYAGQHQNKNDLNAFLEAETGAGPGGNIVGRIEELEKVSWKRWALSIGGIAALVVAIVAPPSVVQLWTIDEFKEHTNTTLERIEAKAERDVQTIMNDLPEKTQEARASLSEETMRIERLRAEIDKMKQRVELLGKEIERLEEYEARPSNDADDVLPSTDPDR